MIRAIVSNDHDRIETMMLTVNMMIMMIIVVIPCTIKILIIRYSSGTISYDKIHDIVQIVSSTIITVMIADTNDDDYNDDT